MITSSRLNVPTLTLAVASALLVGLLVVLISSAGAQTSSGARATIKQPLQPKSGPGGGKHTHGFRVHAGGSGVDAWYVFEPTSPKPAKAPVAVIMHGYGEYSGYKSMAALIRHTVRRGTIAIYPRWQTDIATPCPGPYNIEPCITSAVSGIHGALDYLRSKRRRVQPQLRKTSYFGFSFGGIVTANMTNRYEALNLPKPQAIFLDDPHDGALTGYGEPALDDSLAGIPASTKFECHAGEEGVFSEPSQGGTQGSCNAVFPLIGQIPNRNKDLVLTHTDGHGMPQLSAIHGVCAAGDTEAEDFGPVNAYDWNFCWKVWDGLRSCAISGKRCEYALGETREHRSMGRWSDGKPVRRLKIQDRAPILP